MLHLQPRNDHEPKPRVEEEAVLACARRTQRWRFGWRVDLRIVNNSEYRSRDPQRNKIRYSAAGNQGAFGNMCRGGRMFAPNRVWRKWHFKVNKNQRRYALASALASFPLRCSAC